MEDYDEIDLSFEKYLLQQDLFSKDMNLFIDFHQVKLLQEIIISLKAKNKFLLLSNHTTNINDQISIHSASNFVNLVAEAFYESFKSFKFMNEQELNVTLDIYSSKDIEDFPEVLLDVYPEVLIRIPFTMKLHEYESTSPSFLMYGLISHLSLKNANPIRLDDESESIKVSEQLFKTLIHFNKQDVDKILVLTIVNPKLN